MPFGKLTQCLFLALIPLSSSFKYYLKDSVQGSIISLSEQYMYGTNEGPLFFKNGESSIEIDFEWEQPNLPQGNYSVGVMFYRDSKYELEAPTTNVCRLPAPIIPQGYTNVQAHIVPLVENSDGHYKGQIQQKYIVQTGGIIYTVIQPCGSNANSLAYFDGSIIFRNPYGYLPGSDYGYMPFEAVRGFAYLSLATFFAYVLFKYKSTAIKLHYASLFVILVAATESFSWFHAYTRLNKSGDPFCCPYPKSIVFAMATEVVLKTLVRLLLLIVCLGYGIVRPDLEKKEKLSILLLTTAFFITGILQLTSQAKLSKTIKDEATIEALNMFALPAFLADIIFLTWIYSALMNMMELLKANDESYKLEMYNKLARCISIFVVSFTFLLVVVLAVQAQSYNWLWQWIWLLDVAFEVLNFALLATVCIIWRPTRSSDRLSYSKQLATSEEQADAGQNQSNDMNPGGVELVQELAGGVYRESGPANHRGNSTFTIDDRDDESGEEAESYSFNQNKPSLNPFNRTKNASSKVSDQVLGEHGTRGDFV